MGGIGIGYDRSFGPVVIGAELDVALNNGTSIAHHPNHNYSYETKNNGLVTAQAHVGYNFGLPLVPFLSAGLVAGDVHSHVLRTSTGASSADFTEVEPGWTIGAGVEAPLLSSGWGVKAEYRYVDLNDAHGGDNAGLPITTSFHEDMFLLSAVYRPN